MPIIVRRLITLIKLFIEAKQALDRLYRAAGDVVASQEMPAEFLDALSDDLNTPLALSVLHKLAKSANQGDKDAAAQLKACGQMLGLLNETEASWSKGASSADGLSDADIEALITERQEARQNRDFARADAIRDELANAGISLLDGADGTSWERH